MNLFNSILEAAEFAATLCAEWGFATSAEKYDKKGLLGIAKISDVEYPVDEDSFYLVSPAGAIGFCEDGEDIDWLFLPDSGADEYLPATLQTATQINFCSQCGSTVFPGAQFCGQCGKAI